MSDELKACPFCGSMRVDAWSGLVQCDECHATIAGDTQEDAIEKWSRRTVTPEQVGAAARSIADGLFFAHEIDAGCEHSKDFAIFAFRAAGFEVKP